jgi:hypothetical protein
MVLLLLLLQYDSDDAEVVTRWRRRMMEQA